MKILIAFGFIFIYQLSIVSSGLADNLLTPHLLEPEAYSETYSVFVKEESGIYIKIELAISNLGLGDQNAMCRIVQLGTGLHWSDEELYNRKDWQFDQKGILTIGTCILDITSGTPMIKVELNHRSFQLRFENPLEEVLPDNHLITAGNRFFNQHVLLPWSPVELTISKPSEKDFKSTGHGVIYRFWTTAWPSDLAEYWLRLYGVGAEGTFLLFAWKPIGKSGMEGFILFPDRVNPVTIENCALLNNKPGNYFVKAEAGKRHFEITTDQRFDRHAPVEQLGAFKFLIAPWLGNPVTQTFSATMESVDSIVRGQVVFELTTLD